MTNLFIPKSKNLKYIASFISLDLNQPIGDAAYLGLLKNISLKLPILSDVKNDEENHAIRFFNKEIGYQNQLIVQIEKKDKIKFAWGCNTDVQQVRAFLDSFLLIIHESIELSKFNVGFIDYKIVFEYPFQGNHYSLINKVFFSGSLVGGLFPDAALTSNDISLRALIDDARVCAIDIEGKTTTREIRQSVFEKRDIVLSIAIAKLDFPPTINIQEEFNEHLRIATSFFSTKIQPALIESFDKL